MRKFVDKLPGIGATKKNNLNQYIPVAVAEKWVDLNGKATSDDYMEIAAVEYTEKMHSDLVKPTHLRGYVQLMTPGLLAKGLVAKNFTTPDGQILQVVDLPHHLGPVINATSGTALRVKFVNKLPVGGQLFIPVDKTVTGAGVGPDGLTPYSQNRAVMHLVGGGLPWISAGLPHQWIAPAGETNPGLISVPAAGLTQTEVPNVVTGFTDTVLTWPAVAGATDYTVTVNSVAQKLAALTLTVPNTVGAAVTVTANGLPGAQVDARGVSNNNVPDMADPGPGATTLYFPNDGSSRFMFYHDRTSGLTRLNAYSGMEAGYFVTDATEQGLITGGLIPGAADTIPLIIEDKTFVPSDIAQQDAFWNKNKDGTAATVLGQPGDLWFPHVYEANQDPTSALGTNPVGRFDYGPLFWPIFPAFDPTPTGHTDDATIVPTAYLDTPVVNGTAYPTLTVDPKAYRFRILNASGDRYLNLGLYKADMTPGLAPQLDPNGNPIFNGTGVQQFFSGTEVKLVPALADGAGNPPVPANSDGLLPGSVLVAPYNPAGVAYDPTCQCQYPALPQNNNVASSGPARAWAIDARRGGVPDPLSVGPDIIAIGNDGGFLPNPVDIPSQPITYEANKRSITVNNAYGYGLLLGPAERSDAIIDFAAYAGQTLIVYNDAPAPFPFSDERNDYYTGNPDLTGVGGAYATKPGYGPNTRTIMQIKVNPVAGVAPKAFDPTPLLTALPAAYAASQPAPLVPAVAYNKAFATNDPNIYARIATGAAAQPTLDFTTAGAGAITLTGLQLVTSGGTVNAAGTTIVYNTGSGSGYDPLSPPIVVFNNTVNGVSCLGAGGASASATATVDPVTRQVSGFAIFNPGAGYTCLPTVSFVNTAPVSTIGVLAGGSGYSAPNVTITPVVPGEGTGATATATVGNITSAANVTVLPGSGYTNPGVTVSGGGVAAVTGTATVGISPVASLVLGNGGSNYIAPTVSFIGGGGTGAAATATVGTAGVTVTVVPGSSYTNPVVTVTGGGLPSVTGAATVGTSAATVTIANPGAGYTAPSITVSGGGVAAGSVTGTVTVGNSPIATLALGNPGSGYTVANVSFSGGGGTGAVATATVGTSSVSVAMLSGGAGYTKPVVSVTGGGVTGTMTGSATVGTSPATVTVSNGGSGYNTPVVMANGTTVNATVGVSKSAATLASFSGGSGYTAPVITVSGGGAIGSYIGSATVDVGGTGAITSITLPVDAVFTSIPSIAISDSTGNGASAVAAVSVAGAITSVVLDPTLVFTSTPTITVTEGTNSNAIVSATVLPSAGTITAVTVPSAAFTSTPTITIADAGASTAATFTASLIDPNAGKVTGVTLSNPGSGYTTPPTVTIADAVSGTGTGASATVSLGTNAGTITGVTLTPNSGFTSAPIITITEAGSTSASVTTAVDPTAGTITGVTLTPSTGFTSAPTIAITEGTNTSASATAVLGAGGGAVTVLTLTNAGTGYTSAPTIAITEGINTTATAIATVNPIAGQITGVTLTPNNGFTSAPVIAITDPNPTATGASATVTVTGVLNAITGITVTNPGKGYSVAPTITVTDPAGNGATAIAGLAPTLGVGAQVAVSSTGGNVKSIPIMPLAEQELFDNRGRYNYTGGVEMPFTNAINQTTVPLNYIDAATESITDVVNQDVQVWKITVNGLFSNNLSFNMADVQLLNRVGWDGTVKPPSSNEVGWKNTVRMNPLEDVVIAVRAKRASVPFGMPKSSRLQDPSKPLGALGSEMGFTLGQGVPQLTTLNNRLMNYDNEFFWNSSMLSNSENDFMRPIVFKPTVVVPDAPTNLTDPLGNGTLTWTDPTPAGQVASAPGVVPAVAATLANPKNEIGFKILQASMDVNGIIGAFAPALTAAGVPVTLPANSTSWAQPLPVDPSKVYAVLAYNAAGDSLPTVGFAETIPVAPTPLTYDPATLAFNSVSLSWTGGTPSNKLELWRTTTVGGVVSAPVLVTTLPGTAKGYVDKTVTALMSYTYQIYAVNALQPVAVGTAISAPLDVTTPMIPVTAPAVVTAKSNNGGTAITVSWTDSANNETAYQVDVSANGGLFAAVNANVPYTLTRTPAQGTAVAPVATTPNVTLTPNFVSVPGNTYVFRVTAINVTGAATSTSTPTLSPLVDLSIPVLVLPAPATLTPGLQTATKAPFSWTAAVAPVTVPATAVSYAIEVSVNGGAWGPLSTTNTLAANPTIAVDNTYLFRVVPRATRFGVTVLGTPSTPLTVTTAPLVSTVPVAAAGAPGSGVITLTWSNTSLVSVPITFTIDRRVGGVWVPQAPVAAGTLATATPGTYSWTETLVTGAAGNRYRVLATNGTWSSAYTATSNTVTAP
jgi:hypothetical protein